jgi:hypothetical protein
MMNQRNPSDDPAAFSVLSLAEVAVPCSIGTLVAARQTTF